MSEKCCLLQESSGSLLQSCSGSLRPAASLGAPANNAARPAFAMTSEDDAVSAIRLEDLVSSACAADAVSRLVSARVREAAAAAAASAAACPPIPESPAVAALEAAASSLALNLKSVLGRGQPVLPSQRSWSSSNKVRSAAFLSDKLAYHQNCIPNVWSAWTEYAAA